MNDQVTESDQQAAMKLADIKQQTSYANFRFGLDDKGKPGFDRRPQNDRFKEITARLERQQKEKTERELRDSLEDILFLFLDSLIDNRDLGHISVQVEGIRKKVSKAAFNEGVATYVSELKANLTSDSTAIRLNILGEQMHPLEIEVEDMVERGKKGLPPAHPYHPHEWKDKGGVEAFMKFAYGKYLTYFGAEQDFLFQFQLRYIHPPKSYYKGHAKECEYGSSKRGIDLAKALRNAEKQSIVPRKQDKQTIIKNKASRSKLMQQKNLADQLLRSK